MSFEFRTVPHIISRTGCTAELGQMMADHFDTRRVMVVTDEGLVKAGVTVPVLDSLKAAGFEVTVFDKVVADPPETILLDAVKQAQEAASGLVIGLGGGSSMDVAKLVALMAISSQPLSEMYGVGNVTGERLPLVQIPTTAGTGSEVTPISIITTGETTKMGVVSPQLYADMAILDAALTTGLPARHTAATGIDAMVHAIESYTSKIKKNPVSDALAREALRLLSGNLVTVCKDGSNLEARQAMLLGSMLAGQAFANAPVGAVHALAYPIGGIFHVPHGLSNALVLPHVLRFNAPVAASLYAELAPILRPGAEGSDEALTQVFIDELDKLADAVEIDRKLTQVGINHNDLPRMAEDAMLQTRLLVNNPREVSQEQALAIYQEAL
ncbi:MAG: iron-containing alcohol dehydrogenase [Alphaproteobacteria bacterium]|nr:iron-containing alcohol dehydrogenase [Alphaproteobacteria bacterium SS10]